MVLNILTIVIYNRKTFIVLTTDSACGLHYESAMIVIYSCNDSGLFYKQVLGL
jgi:hypothetical protein